MTKEKDCLEKFEDSGWEKLLNRSQTGGFAVFRQNKDNNKLVLSTRTNKIFLSKKDLSKIQKVIRGGN